MSEDVKQPQDEGFLDSVDIGYDTTGGKSVTVAIDHYKPAGEVKDASGTVVNKPVLYFAKAKKALILNRTNEKALILIHGKDRDKWQGQPVTLTVRFVNAFGQSDVPTIRVEPPKGLPLTFGMRKWQGKAKPSGGAR